MLMVGVLFWLSPLRTPWHWETSTASPDGASSQGPAPGVGALGLERVGRGLRTWEALPEEDREAVLKGVVRSLPPITVGARNGAGAPRPAVRSD
jgi:hypothetical protein